LVDTESMPVTQKGRTTEVRKLNDLLRCHWIGGEIVISGEVSELLEPMALGDLLYAMGQFDSFSSDNDPHGEHDLGALEMFGHKFFWTIDYYNVSLDGYSPDPADPNLTYRVLTLRLASEYVHRRSLPGLGPLPPDSHP
jgi:hypothetical protein